MNIILINKLQFEHNFIQIEGKNQPIEKRLCNMFSILNRV